MCLAQLAHHHDSAATGDRTRDARFEIPDANHGGFLKIYILKIFYTIQNLIKNKFEPIHEKTYIMYSA